MIRVLLSLHAREGSGGDVLRVLERRGVLTLASGQPGFLGIEVSGARDDADELLVVESWSSAELYDRWSDGAAATAWLDELDGLLSEPPATRLYHVVEAVR